MYISLDKHCKKAMWLIQHALSMQTGQMMAHGIDTQNNTDEAAFNSKSGAKKSKLSSGIILGMPPKNSSDYLMFGTW